MRWLDARMIFLISIVLGLCPPLHRHALIGLHLCIFLSCSACIKCSHAARSWSQIANAARVIVRDAAKVVLVKRRYEWEVWAQSKLVHRRLPLYGPGF